ncbi:MAG: DUF5689 domain-containing protein [Paludibacteraceae bacterium]|nr:DUF5689 domain-containing protein [Paludibacteraceae bacterium]
MKKSVFNISALLFSMGCMLLAACTPDEPTKLYISEIEADAMIEAGQCLTIEEFKATYMTEEGNYCMPDLYRERSKAGNYYLFSIDTIPVSDTPIYIRGRVTTDDYAGNFYKTLCIQQVFVNGNDTTQQALRLSVDAGSIGGLYQLGQEILIRVDGLAIGRYANQPQLCLPSYNNNIYANYAEQKVGWAAGRIPFAVFKARTQCIGLPDQSQLYYETLAITDFNHILDLKEARSLDAKLVRIKDVHFTGQYYDYGVPKDCKLGDPETDQDANVFAPTTNNMNFPQARVFYDLNNNYSAVSTSEYAKYAHFYLPADNYWGDVVGILGFYYDNGLKYNGKYESDRPAKDDWTISIRSVDDLQLYDGDEHWLYDAEGNYKPGYEYSKN